MNIMLGNMKTETIICDRCRKEVAEEKCFFCEKDTCNTCASRKSFRIMLGSVTLQRSGDLMVCCECSLKYFQYGNDEHGMPYPTCDADNISDEQLKALAESFKKIIAVRNLENAEKPKKKKGLDTTYPHIILNPSHPMTTGGTWTTP